MPKVTEKSIILKVQNRCRLGHLYKEGLSESALLPTPVVSNSLTRSVPTAPILIILCLVLIDKFKSNEIDLKPQKAIESVIRVNLQMLQVFYEPAM